MKINKTLFFVLLLCLSMIFLLQSCGGGGGGRSYKQTEHMKSNVGHPESKAVSDIDKKITKLIHRRNHLRDEQQSLADSGVSYKKLDKSGEDVVQRRIYRELSSRYYAKAAETEIKIQRLERKMEKLEHKREELLKQSSGCFLPETLVKMEDGSLKPFVNLQPGQKVLTYDIGYDKLVNKQVIEVYSVKANHLYTINSQLTTTGGERLLTKDGWKKIRNLKQGDFVHLGGSMVKIKSIDYVRTNRTLYNMQVADTHNFYVVTTDGSSYLVHNSSGSAGGGSK